MSQAIDKIYLVDNGGEYSDYTVLGLFTDKGLAMEFAAASRGTMEEWPANVPQDQWVRWECNLNAHRKHDFWETRVIATDIGICIQTELTACDLGWESAWGRKDPTLGIYTCGYSVAFGKSEEQARKRCVDAFWKLVEERDAQ